MSIQPVSQESRERFARRGINTRLRNIFDSIDTKLDAKIDFQELSSFLKKLGYRPEKDLIKNMIWEVDEDHDEKVGWEEFQRAYERCSNDIHGTEPRQLYNVVLFLLHTSTSTAGAGPAHGSAGDKENGVVERKNDGGGGKDTVVKMSGEDAERLMYLQFGRDGMDVELAATFGKTHDTVQDLTLEEFLRGMTARDVSLRPKGGRRQDRRQQRQPASPRPAAAS